VEKSYLHMGSRIRGMIRAGTAPDHILRTISSPKRKVPTLVAPSICRSRS
jgi:hypothetical protein